MRRILTTLALAATLPMMAQEANQPRIAFFNFGQLVESSVKAKKVFTEFEVTRKNLTEKLEAKQAEGQKIQAQLQSTSISDAGKEQLQKQLRDLDYEFKKLNEDSQAELQKVQRKVMGEMNAMVMPVVESLAKEQKLALVLSVEQAGPIITWADSEWIKTFTAEVAKRLDASSDAPAAAPKPVAKPAAKK